MLTNTQLLLVASVVLEHAKAVNSDSLTPSSLKLVQNLTKAATFGGVIIPDDVAPTSKLDNPIALIGAMSLKLKDEDISTWDGEVVNMPSFERVFDVALNIDPSQPSSDGVTAGNLIIDSLPPLVKTMVHTAKDVLAEAHGQQPASNSDQLIPDNNEPPATELLIDPETRCLNKRLVSET